MNAVDTYHLAGLHNIFGMNKACGFRRVYNMDLDLTDELHQDPQELNSYTMKSFASVLANQLMKFADVEVTGRVPRRNLGGGGSLPSMPLARTRGQERVQQNTASTYSNRLMRDAMNISSDEDDTANGAKTKLATPEDGVLYEVHEEIYDVNGKVHQAVRMGTSVNSQGTQGRQVARFCVNKYKACQERGFSFMHKCPMYCTRVKCLQCNMPLCYPLKFSHNEEKRKNSTCFMTHVNGIARDNVESQRKFVRMVSNKQNE